MTSGRLFLIGAAKCGTTTVDSMLRSHPDVYMSPIKEPNFYSTDIDPGDFSDFYTRLNVNDLERYFAHPDPLPMRHLDFVRKREWYERLFSANSGQKWLGESSTSYLFSTEAARNIAAEFPDARILVCLRDPVDRMMSHYRMALQLGYVDVGIDEAIRRDQTKEPRGWGRSELFVELGMYGTQLSRWYDHFPAEQISIIDFEDIVYDQQKVRDDLATFLNVSIFAENSPVHANEGTMPRFPRLNSALRRMRIARSAKHIMPDSALSRVKHWMNRAPQRSVELDETVWRRYYRSEIELLERITGRDFKYWKRIN